MSNFKLVDGKKVALSATEEQDLVDSATQHAIDMTAYDAQAYARNRASAYASVGDQLDMMMKDKRDGTTTHQTACEAVKTQFPKE